MSIQILGSFDKNQIYCAGSFTKFVTTYVVLSLLSEKYDINKIVDDPQFLDTLCSNESARAFLSLFQKTIGSTFSIRDLCSYYSGLPYTFDLAPDELEPVDQGAAFKHHSILDEKVFLERCNKSITQVYPARSKFHYSEIAIIFLAYFIEQASNTKMEALYQKYIVERFQLKNSVFSRMLVPNTFYQDLTNKYDYPTCAKQNHGFFAYSNGFYTTQSDTQIMLEQMIATPVFKLMTDASKARAASNRLMNGMAVEIRIIGDDILYGYEGLSCSGCNIWNYSTKFKKGFLTFTDDEDSVYPFLYGQFNYSEFDKVPNQSQALYQAFLKSYDFAYEQRNVPTEYQGIYHRVRMNEFNLEIPFQVGSDFIVIRNPEEVRFELVYYKNDYRIKNKDNVHGSKVGFYQAKSGNRYMMFDGNLYRFIR